MPWTFYNSNGQRLSSAATNISVLDIDGATDIGADIADADLFIIDDGAGGTNRKTAASRIITYVGANTDTRSGVAKAYGSVASDGTLQSNSYNIASYAKASTGNYTATWDTDFANTNYSSHVNAEDSSYYARAGTPATGTQAVNIRNTSGSAEDSAHNITAFGDQ